MSDQRIILHYARRHSRLPAIVMRLRRAFIVARWVLFRRGLSSAEIFGICWTGLAIVWVVQSSYYWRWDNIPGLTPLPIPLTFFAVVSLADVLVSRQWRRAAWCVALAIALAIPAGMLQLESCPHATYVQVMGVSF